jgi:serine/threonine-protein kinase
LHSDLGAALGAERFEREIHVVSRFSHPNILSVDDSGETNGKLWYVMPFVRGETLRARLDREKQLPVPDAVAITCEVAEALDYAHRQGIIHRDIKPENILLEDGHAIVADFGIARAASALGERQLTQTGMTLGTPSYMSPEQGTADKNIDGRADIYSLGCVLYEMLAGEPPFGGPTAQVIIARHSLADVPSLSIARGTVPEELEDAVLRALAKAPVDRFATASEFAEALKESLATDGKSHGRADRRARSRRGKRPKRSRKSYMIMAAAVVPVVAGLAFAGVHSLKKSPASRMGSDSDPSRIAVLYFEDQSEGGKLKFLADGLTESLIDELSAVKGLKVISRNGVAPFKGKVVAPDSVQRALKIGTIVQGKVAQSGDRLRVSVSLADALTGEAIGKSKTIEAGRGDLFKLQDSIAKEVSMGLRAQLGPEIEDIVNRPGTSNTQAWEALQRAKQTLAGVDEARASGGVQAAVDRLSAADGELAAVEEMDKKWVTPIVLRGFAAHRKMQLIGNTDPSQIPKWLDVAAGHAERALALSPQNADALELRGTVRYFRWAYNQSSTDLAAATKLMRDAEADFQAAVKANPLQATAWNGLSYVLNAENKYANAKLAAQTAYESDPYLKDIDRTIWRLFQNSYALNNLTESKKWCDLGRQRAPDNFRFIQCRLQLFSLPGQKPSVDSIWTVYRDFVDKSPANVKEFNKLKGGMLAAAALARAGVSPDSVRAVIMRSRGNSTVDPTSELLSWEAQVRAQIGDKEDVIKLLTKFFAANPQYRPFAKDDDSWWWDSVKEDPSYKALVGGGS